MKVAENKVLNEAEASIMMELANKIKHQIPMLSDYVVRITREWFDARRAVGIQPYGEGDLVEKIKQARREGLEEGIRRFAWWKDGAQYVGTTGKTLKKALEEI